MLWNFFVCLYYTIPDTRSIEYSASVSCAVSTKTVDFKRKAVIQIAAHEPAAYDNATAPSVIVLNRHTKLAPSNGLVTSAMSRISLSKLV